MNTPEYKILEALTTKELQTFVNQAIMEAGKNVTLIGGLVAEIYPNFPPKYYQAILVQQSQDNRILLESFGIDYKAEQKRLNESLQEDTQIKKPVETEAIVNKSKKSKKDK